MVPAIDAELNTLSSAAAKLAGDDVLRVVPVRGGGNNRLYRIDGASGSAYALKTYLVDRHDCRDRLGAEYQGLSFVWSRGVRDVPRAVAADPEHARALYDWIDGAPVDRATVADIDSAVRFLAELKRLSRDPMAASLPLASEACLSGAEIVAQIETRVQRLTEAAKGKADLVRFLSGVFEPTVQLLVSAAREGFHASGVPFARQVGFGEMTLSPSDFGFHNALRRPDGSLVFLDFEYFGWDDPVKLVADFLLHPGMRLDEKLCRRFFGGVTQVFGGDPLFELRVRLLYPLFGLRWVAILLNEFLPERWQRRVYAGAKERERAEARQLEKAKLLVRRLIAGQKGFPHAA
ncbi:MAG TPA: hypothetical protein VEU47_02900 [Candidatus Cybelea sp.]|nr:hypothetical protein [Candidatus Cybelea sp.]